MSREVEIYQQVKSMVAPSVDTDPSQGTLEAGEPEFATAGLLDEAYSAGALTREIIDYVESIYTDGPVIEMLEALRMFEGRSGVAE